MDKVKVSTLSAYVYVLAALSGSSWVYEVRGGGNSQDESGPGDKANAGHSLSPQPSPQFRF